LAGAPPTSPAIRIPNPAPAAPPGLEHTAELVLSWLKWGGVIAGLAGLFISAIMMGIGRRNRHALAVEGASGIPWVIAAISLVAIAPALVDAFI
jgi:hypothetical protein